jgi:hypothetical protein
MQWLLALETERDPISTCRLMNIFRRKGVSVLRLELESGPSGFSLAALVETRESDLAHIFNFLRRTEGVREVTCYRHKASESTSTGPGVDDDGLARSAARLSGDGPSVIIYSSRAISHQSDTVGARSNAPVETLSGP